jgi:hypothetical protein
MGGRVCHFGIVKLLSYIILVSYENYTIFVCLILAYRYDIWKILAIAIKLGFWRIQR